MGKKIDEIELLEIINLLSKLKESDIYIYNTTKMFIETCSLMKKTEIV